MSLENLFIIRPEGLVSKNRIVAERMLLNIRLCNLIELRMHTHKKSIDLEHAILDNRTMTVIYV